MVIVYVFLMCVLFYFALITNIMTTLICN